MGYRIFTRVVWRKNPNWPNGLEPNAVPMDSCPTVHRVDTFDEAVEYCTAKNDARPDDEPERSLSPFHEFTED